jgi:ethanolamine utilization protein EutA
LLLHGDRASDAHTHGGAGAAAEVHSHAHGGHAHEHGEPGVVSSQVLSVGVDIGSTTTHLTLSRLTIARSLATTRRKPEIVDRAVVYRSPIHLTPARGADEIDAEQVRDYLAAAYREAGVTRDDVQAGALICTGIAARKANAASLSTHLAELCGEFVCVTAGPMVEGRLAAFGSGAAEYSREWGEPVLNVDVGGGTTKCTLTAGGSVRAVAALDVGARLFVLDEHDRVQRIEPAGHTIAEALNVSVSVGAVLSRPDQERLASGMARAALAAAGLLQLDDLARSLLITGPLPAPSPATVMVLSGGVAEFAYGRESASFGDLGGVLGPAMRAAVEARLPGRVLQPLEGIRATVIGACQYTLQLSGDTVFVGSQSALPIHNLLVTVVDVPWTDLRPERVAERVVSAAEAVDPETPYALYFGRPPVFGYSVVQPLAEGIALAAPRLPHLGTPLVLLFRSNLGRSVGQQVARLVGAATDVICVDELTLGTLQLIDVGQPVEVDSYLPVVVKDLVFG